MAPATGRHRRRDRHRAAGGIDRPAAAAAPSRRACGARTTSLPAGAMAATAASDRLAPGKAAADEAGKKPAPATAPKPPCEDAAGDQAGPAAHRRRSRRRSRPPKNRRRKSPTCKLPVDAIRRQQSRRHKPLSSICASTRQKRKADDGQAAKPRSTARADAAAVSAARRSRHGRDRRRGKGGADGRQGGRRRFAASLGGREARQLSRKRTGDDSHAQATTRNRAHLAAAARREHQADRHEAPPRRARAKSCCNCPAPSAASPRRSACRPRKCCAS